MTITSSLPTISSIQRTNVVLIATLSVLLAVFSSSNRAISCALGGAVVVANLFALAALGRLAMGVAAGGAKRAAKLGFLAVPLKMLIVVALVYIAFAQTHIDGLGFALGVLTQMIAIIIETTRARMSSRSALSSAGEASCQSQ